MAVFSVFAHGTNETSSSTYSIINEFQRACHSSKLCIDGPKIWGLEVSEHSKKATIEIINWLLQQKDVDNNLNCAGFSRGSITLMHIANLLKIKQTELENQTRNTLDDRLLSRLKALNISVFAFDPVAGLNDKAKRHARWIPDNVKSYVAMLQLDEMRRDFKPQDMSRILLENPRVTKATFLPMYGNHSDITKIKHNGMASGPKIAWYMLYYFLIQRGTQFKGANKIPYLVTNEGEQAVLDGPFDLKKLLKLFSQHHLERDVYRKSGLIHKVLDGLPIPRAPRSINSHLHFYVKDPDFFINQLERELFKITYPRAFNYLFENAAFDFRFPKMSGNQLKLKDVIEELQTIRKENPYLFKRLESRGLHCAVDNSITLFDSKGGFHIEPCTHIQQFFPQMLPATIQKHRLKINKLSQLEFEVYAATFRYQREKSEWNFWCHRAQTARAQSIRKAVHNIMRGAGTNEIKYDLILNKLEEEYKNMVVSLNKSDLTNILKGVLQNHGRQYNLQRSLSNESKIGCLTLMLDLLKGIVGFIGYLGYVGGPILYGFGNALFSLGKRFNELLSDCENPFCKYLGLAVAHSLIWIGFAIKNSFGLRPLTFLAMQSLRDLKEQVISALNPVEIERVALAEENSLIPD